MLDARQIFLYNGEDSIRTIFEKYNIGDLKCRFPISYQSKIIESILISVPIGEFVFLGFDDCIKGAERLRAIKDFVNGEYALTNLRYIANYEGLRYSELPHYSQQKILHSYLPIIRINYNTPLEIQNDLITRLDLS